MDLTQMILYSIGATLLLTFALLNHMTDNWLIKLLWVKMGRGRRTFIAVISETHTYYSVGKINDGVITFKDSAKEERKVGVDRSQVWRSWGVNVFFIDEKTNAVLKPDFNVVNGFDAVRYANLIKRALTLPRLDDKKMLLLLIGVGLLVLGMFFIGYKVVNIETGLKAINAVQAQTTTIV